MTTDRINKINELIEKLKVIKEEEYQLESGSEFIKIKRGRYTLNNGESIERDTVDKTISSSNGTMIIPITKDNKILIEINVRCALPTKDKISIELPAGYIELGESSIDGAKRELLEETGYIGETYTLIDSYYPAIGVSSQRLDMVLATNVYKIKEQSLDFDEFILFEEVTIDELSYLIKNNYIKDLNTRYAYYKILDYLNNRSELNEEKE